MLPKYTFINDTGRRLQIRPANESVDSKEQVLLEVRHFCFYVDDTERERERERDVCVCVCGVCECAGASGSINVNTGNVS